MLLYGNATESNNKNKYVEMYYERKYLLQTDKYMKCFLKKIFSKQYAGW